MIKHKEVIQAWLDGKDIQFKSNTRNEWADFSEELVSNPMTFQSIEWRVKPEVKQVDYQALIDSELLVSFYNMFDSGETPYLIDKLKSYNETHCIDHKGNYWDCICPIDDLRQVIDTRMLDKLNNAGFLFSTLCDFVDYKDKDSPKTVIILQGIQDGYTL